jgi:predicted metalloendopeptidase
MGFSQSMAKKILILLCFILSSCNGDGGSKRVFDVNFLSNALGVDLRYFDSSVRPQDDFYQYVNGRWINLIELPEDRSSFGSFSEVTNDVNYEILTYIQSILITPVESLTPQQIKIRNLTTSFNNLEAVERNGLSALAIPLDKIENLKTNDDIVHMIGYLSRLGVKGPIEIEMDPDLADPTTYLTQLTQSGLTLPGKTYYDWSDAKGRALKAKFQSYIETMLGADVGVNRIQGVIGLETRLSGIQINPQDQRDLVRGYNRYDRPRLKLTFPKVNWDSYFSGLGYAPKAVNIREPSFIKGLGQLIKSAPLEAWKDYFRVQLLGKMAGYLPRNYDLARHNLHEKAVRGLTIERERDLRGFALTNMVFSNFLSQEYIKEKVDPTVRVRVQTMVDNIKAAFKVRLINNPWMDEPTKAEALKKLEALRVRIGWPNTWTKRGEFTIKPDDIAGNMVAYFNVTFDTLMKKADTAVRFDDWPVPAHTVNAMYSPTLNTMTLPIGIFNTPFFDVNANEAVNYGGIGAIIGHEIIHGFDDQGRKFDSTGTLHDWWSQDSEAEFTKRANSLVRLYDGIELIEGAGVNGRQTLGENIADIGGVAIAYEAYKRSLDGWKSKTIVGFTGEQRFLMGWAQVWRRVYRDEELRRRIAVDSHAPTKLRVNIVMSMFPGFSEAFDLKPKDKLYKKPEEQIVIY